MSVGEVQPHHTHAEIKSQIKLPFSKAWEISIKSIKIRFARSIITASGIMLGIAFFSSVRMAATFSDIQKDIIVSTQVRIANGSLKPTEADMRLVASAVTDQKEEQSAKNRLQWLSIMALVVCTVGITNSMLMSVTERYKEIGTMKCLGALDSFVVKLFFIESCLVGFISSVTGFVVGWLVISVVHLISDGLPAFGITFWNGSLGLACLSILLGTGLTFIATIAPAMRAAKMPPAAALRVEI